MGSRSALLFTAILSFVMLEAVLSQSCFTTVGGAGQCVPPSECAFIQKLIEVYGRNIPRQIGNQLRQMRCDGNTNEVHICCRNEATPQASNTQTTQTKVVRATNGDINSYSRQGLQYLNSFTNCGNKGNPKVSGGIQARLGEFPWMALLKYRSDSQRPFFCGGSLISDRHVLTAAHCIIQQPDVIAVRLGEHDLSKEEDCTILGGFKRICQPPYEEYEVDRVHVHPNYVHGQINYDLAVVRLKEQVRPKSHIQPVCLPIDQRSQELTFNQDFFIAGWGKTDKQEVSNTLQKAIVTRQSLDTCRQYYNKGEVNDNHICATGEDLQHTCPGDSGSPLFFKHHFKRTIRYVQYGVVSFGGQWCGRNNHQPGVFASVIDMLPWITQVLQ
ncbi:melanization protease 1 [Drosophila serrata]|uniref:melanization protease 1 n=1 Tax=Drosophila serrata TaxID=7274 RepID=UPI000A1D1666|nr:melanization protease 1 [Drosophila serrata]